jgi:flotillin
MVSDQTWPGDRQVAIARAEGERQAAINRAKGKDEIGAEGEGRRLRSVPRTAEADVIRLKLMAEAEGIDKSRGFQETQRGGQTLQILEALKEIIPHSLKELAPVMGEIAKPLGNVDRISIVDFGGNNPNGEGGVARYAKLGPVILTQFVESAKALGLDPSGILNLLKMRPADMTTSEQTKEKE